MLPAGALQPAWQLDPRSLDAGDASQTAAAAAVAPPADAGLHTSQQHATTSSAAASSTPLQLRTPHVPRTSQEFAREWRRHCLTPGDKYRCVQSRAGGGGRATHTHVLLRAPHLFASLRATMLFVAIKHTLHLRTHTGCWCGVAQQRWQPCSGWRSMPRCWGRRCRHACNTT